MRRIGLVILGLIAFYVFISERSSGEAAAVLTSATIFYGALITLLLHQ